MNILILNHNRIWESSFNRAFYFARPLVRRGHSVTVVTNSKKQIFSFEEYVYEGVNIIETPDIFWGKLRTGWDPLNALRRCYFLKSRKFDIIHAIDCRPTVIIPALYLKKRWKVPLVIDWLDWWGRGGIIDLRSNKILNKLFEPIETYFEENFRKYADYTTVISTLLRERAINLGINKEKIKVISHGCDTDDAKPLDKATARKELGLSDYDFILLFSGFVLYDLHISLDAFSQVLERYPNTLLILTGSHEHLDGKCKKRWKGNTHILNLGFLSKQKYSRVLGACDLCMLPLSDNLANRARFPGRLGDYMAAGRPVISNDVGDVGSLIKEYNIGALTKPTPDEYARGIINALQQPRNLAIWGNNARKLAQERLSFDILSKDFEQIYTELIKS